MSRSVVRDQNTRDGDWGDCTPEEAVEAVKAVRKSQPASGPSRTGGYESGDGMPDHEASPPTGPAPGAMHRCDECGGSGTWPYHKGETPRPFHYRECSQGTPPRRTLWDATCWRTGRKVGRTIYAQLDAEPSDDDPLIGVMDTPELAALVVEAVNATRKSDGAL